MLRYGDEDDATLRVDDKSNTNNSEESSKMSVNRCKVGKPHEEAREAHGRKQ
jgi:hypothetical protein